jgi:hypothetical protein
VYKELLGMRKQEINDDVILGVIEQSSAGVAKRRRTAADVFLMITGREASEHELDDLALTNVEDIADRVKDMPLVPLNREVAQDLDLDCESVCAEPESADGARG